MPKKTVLDFQQMKKKGEKITYLTAYDFPMASFCEKAGIDISNTISNNLNCHIAVSLTLPISSLHQLRNLHDNFMLT